MHALKRIHQALAPEGVLVDMHPIPPPRLVEAGGTPLGHADQAEFLNTVEVAEAALEETVAGGLFEHELETEFDWVEIYDSGEELLEAASEWEDSRLPPSLARRIRAAHGPLSLRDRLVVRRLRAV